MRLVEIALDCGRGIIVDIMRFLDPKHSDILIL